MTRRSGRRGIGFAWVLIPLLLGVLAAGSPAQAQFSEGYRFLDAVKKKEGQKVEDALNEPGSTIINARDVTSGETAMHIVTARRDVTWMRFLMAKGANINVRDGRGRTPLQIATNLGFLEGVSLLVEDRADLNAANDAGETPLITAVHRRDIPMIRTLLKAGADPDRADNSGRSAREYARLEGRSSPLLAEIEANAKAKTGAAGGKPVYGPTF